MYLRCSLVSAILFCLHVGASPVLDKHQTELKEHYEHLAYIAEFPCHVPQPRVVSVHELFAESQTRGKAFFPDVTVLHYCDESAGCCTSGHHCAPLHTETVGLPFKITFLEDIEKHKRGSWIIEYHYVSNHTECDCVETHHTPHYPDSSQSSPSPHPYSEHSEILPLPSYPSQPSGSNQENENSWQSSNIKELEESSSPSINQRTSTSSSLEESSEELFPPSSSQEPLSLEYIEQLLQSAAQPEDQRVQTSQFPENSVQDSKLTDDVCEESNEE